MLDYHRTLLEDEMRVTALRQAVARTVQPGDVVVDLGCGTGILAFFACEAGARRVFALEREHMADVAAFLARHLQLADRVTVLHQPSTAIELPERADVLLTETIGAAGLDENILGLVLDARKRLLRENARIVPRRLALIAAPADVPEPYERHVAFWGRAQSGLDFSPLRVFASNAMLLLKIGDEAHVAAPAVLADVDFAAATSTLVRGAAESTTTRDATVHGFALWFRATLADEIVLTNQNGRARSWAQAFLPLDTPLPVTRGTPVALAIETDDGKVWRWRGRIGETEFDQTTILNRPPCTQR
ncbi:MAG TPA: 50S ribosomal protein L11 methyltransferase [Thermoanaerobaculia bacterium]|nr:50S ribosomal protein L11 methyltransferase [Thermoanaerobaculia bacterium]